MSAGIRRVRFFFFNDTAPTEIYTLSLPAALPISPAAAPRALARRGARAIGRRRGARAAGTRRAGPGRGCRRARGAREHPRSEEHTSELQSRQYLVCRLLLEKKKDDRRVGRQRRVE